MSEDGKVYEREMARLQADLTAARAALGRCVEALRQLANDLEAGAHTLFREKAILSHDRDWLLGKAQRAKAIVSPDALAAIKETHERKGDT